MLCCQVKAEVTCVFCNKQWCRDCWHKKEKVHRRDGMFGKCPKAPEQNLRWKEPYLSSSTDMRWVSSYQKEYK